MLFVTPLFVPFSYLNAMGYLGLSMGFGWVILGLFDGYLWVILACDFGHKQKKTSYRLLAGKH